VQQGTFSYTSPEGQLITIHYTADETGFHAQGDHIPTPPPVSEEIQKGLDLIYAGIRQQEVSIRPFLFLLTLIMLFIIIFIEIAQIDFMKFRNIILYLINGILIKRFTCKILV